MIGFDRPTPLQGATKVFMGEGFRWEQSHAQTIRHIKGMDRARYTPPGIVLAIRKALGLAPARDPKGNPAIFGIGARQAEPVLMDAENLYSHVAVLGTTGAGKGRMLEQLLAQRIMAGDACIILDPKLDPGILNRAYACCRRAGKPDAFHLFHPGWPGRSVRLDLLKNFNRVSEIASRIESLIPAGAGDINFRKFAWRVLNDLVNGQTMAGENPSVASMRRYIAKGFEDLFIRACRGYLTNRQAEFPNWEIDVDNKTKIYRKKYSDSPLKAEAFGMRDYYWQYVHDPHSRCESLKNLEGLISVIEHDSSHMTKMITSLTPILSGLCDGALEGLLSPDYDDPHDQRPILDLRRVIEKGEVVYVVLDSLANQTIGEQLGALVLADLTAAAGAKYNEMRPSELSTTIMVDELASVISEPFINSINKVRGVNFSIIFGAQVAVSDMAARFGSRDKANIVLGNANTYLIGRLRDIESRELASRLLGTTRMSMDQVNHQTSTKTDRSDIDFTRSIGVRSQVNDNEPLVDPDTFGELPDLHFMASLADGRKCCLRVPFEPVPEEERYPIQEYRP